MRKQVLPSPTLVKEIIKNNLQNKTFKIKKSSLSLKNHHINKNILSGSKDIWKDKRYIVFVKNFATRNIAIVLDKE